MSNLGKYQLRPKDITETENRKLRYSHHVDTLNKSKHLIDNNNPKMYHMLPLAVFNGGGPV